MFEDTRLQQFLLEQLRQMDVPYRVDEAGRAWYTEADEERFGDATSVVRDHWSNGKPWYLVSWDEPPDTVRYRDILLERRMAFAVEQTPGFTWFLLLRADRSVCDAAAEQLWAEATAGGNH